MRLALYGTLFAESQTNRPLLVVDDSCIVKLGCIAQNTITLATQRAAEEVS